MQYIRGKLTKTEDLIMMLNVLKEKKGVLKLSIPYKEGEVEICFDGIFFYVKGEDKSSGDRFQLIKLLEEWITSNILPVFELYEEEECSGGTALTEEELLSLIEDENLQKAKEIPESFVITKIELSKVPSYLAAHWRVEKPVKRNELYRHKILLSEVAKLIDLGLLKIRPYKLEESLPFKLRAFLCATAAVSIIYLILPLNYLQLNAIKFLKAINWALRDKILSVGNTVELPVKGCLNAKFFLVKDEVVNAGIDGTLGTEDDKKVKLPLKGYKPTFALPVK
ncbi:hypothetical protein [Thermovibrio sp.]